MDLSGLSAILAPVLLVACTLAGLLLIPFGLPGLWVMVLGILGFGALTDFRSVGLWTIVIAVGIAGIGEAVEAWLGFRYTKRYGGSSRAAWGALLGGIVGAVVGLPIPIVGSIVGALVGSFAGAVLLEMTAGGKMEAAVGAGWGAVLGRVAATAAKVALGLGLAVMAAWALLSA